MDRLKLIQQQLKDAPNFWALHSIQRRHFQSLGNLKGKTIVISGASRGIGLAIALRAAQDGANIAILAKTAEAHPKLQGTIFTAAQAINKAGGHGLPIQCDIRFQAQVESAIQKVVQQFKGIDILINNASAISLTPTLDTDMKRYDLMHSINTRGTFLLSKACLPHLLKSANPHILNLAPPLTMNKKWFGMSLAYTMAKYGMSMCVLGMSAQYEGQIGVNALWPRTAIATAAVKFALGGDPMIKRSRTTDIMADAAYIILTSDGKKTTGNFFIDDEVVGPIDLRRYNVDPNIPVEELVPDYFL